MVHLSWIFPIFTLFHHESIKMIMINRIDNSQVYVQNIQNIKNKYNDKPLLELNIYRNNNYETDTNQNIFIHDIYKNIDVKNKVIPSYHNYDKFHYQYLYNRYSKLINYNEYCLLEEKLSDILIQFLHDERNIRYLIRFDDPLWLNSNSVKSLMTKEEQSQIKTFHFKNLDHDDNDIINPQDHNIFLWDIKEHDRI